MAAWQSWQWAAANVVFNSNNKRQWVRWLKNSLTLWDLTWASLGWGALGTLRPVTYASCAAAHSCQHVSAQTDTHHRRNRMFGVRFICCPVKIRIPTRTHTHTHTLSLALKYTNKHTFWEQCTENYDKMKNIRDDEINDFSFLTWLKCGFLVFSTRNISHC